MWECRKCSKPVFFAERKQSLGFDWHPNCLRCEECGKRLNPGQHAEHKGVPYCYHPCYGALFGPQLFGHGTRNECHTSFGKLHNRDGQVKRSHLEAQLKTYNQAYEGKPGELKYKEVNGKLMIEGVIKIYWGVKNLIHLKEEDDSLRAKTWKKRSVSAYYSDSEEDAINTTKFNESLDNSTLIENGKDSNENNSVNHFSPLRPDLQNGPNSPRTPNAMTVTPLIFRNTAIKRRPGKRMDKAKLKRRCSINGHFYLRETSSFTPPYGSACSLWVTSKTTGDEMLHMLMDKYKVEMSPSNFALFVVKDNGEQKRIKPDESPLIAKVLLGADENVAKVFILDASKTFEISQEVAQFINLSMAECRAILNKYTEEETSYEINIRKKYDRLRECILFRLEELNGN